MRPKLYLSVCSLFIYSDNLKLFDNTFFNTVND